MFDYFMWVYCMDLGLWCCFAGVLLCCFLGCVWVGFYFVVWTLLWAIVLCCAGALRLRD